MPNGDGGNLKMFAIFNFHNVEPEQWNTEAARHLRIFADYIETNGLNLPSGRFENGTLYERHGRSIFEYSQR